MRARLAVAVCAAIIIAPAARAEAAPLTNAQLTKIVRAQARQIASLTERVGIIEQMHDSVAPSVASVSGLDRRVAVLEAAQRYTTWRFACDAAAIGVDDVKLASGDYVMTDDAATQKAHGLGAVNFFVFTDPRCLFGGGAGLRFRTAAEMR